MAGSYEMRQERTGDLFREHLNLYSTLKKSVLQLAYFLHISSTEGVMK